MFKLFMASALIFAAALPVGAQEVGPGVGRTTRSTGYLAYVCTNDVGGTLTLRTGPGKNYRQMRQIRAGNNIRVMDSTRSSDGFEWFKVVHNNKQGWVRSDYVCTHDGE
ncbi:SH3 domain-containing protein [Tolypothrix sp. FACHB-123]|uniref:SH3 domain-containing protein n=1 Tax=Tolypothrix sp. FACHB-123 TaxID=2692868 RepID=UPI001687CE2A|nr:SH3 domain-containing protein [Tolypothrix sp. FACHB-123]MBD2357477.1 SH3 domain-containing protein [Tolypothrix sp. FACHB-123]